MEKKKISIDGNLYIETTPEIWEKEIIEKYNMLPILKSLYINSDLVTIENRKEFFNHTNKKISFDIITEYGEMELNGVILDVLPIDDKRNIYDFLFIPDSYLDEFKKIENTMRNNYDVTNLFRLGHLINICSAKNFKLK